MSGLVPGSVVKLKKEERDKLRFNSELWLVVSAREYNESKASTVLACPIKSEKGWPFEVVLVAAIRKGYRAVVVDHLRPIHKDWIGSVEAAIDEKDLEKVRSHLALLMPRPM